MTINVYWASGEKEWLRATEPVNIKKLHFSTDAFKETDVIFCPATRDFLDNYYGIKSIYTYDMHFDDDRVWAEQYDHEFFDYHIKIRGKDKKLKCASFMISYIFFTEEESLTMSMEQPFLEDNVINDTCILFPGQFDIAKWFRNIEFAFRLKKKTNHFSIKEGDIYSYIKFHTKEDINFIQFRISDEIKSLMNDVKHAKSHQPIPPYRSLESRYESFSTKELILREIKKNILT
ncbi:hypothetical protein EBS02_00610 [bacterium]|nr:hypothetical protein [bacterium]